VLALAFIGLFFVLPSILDSPPPAPSARDDVQSACQSYRQYLHGGFSNSDVQNALSQATAAAQIDPRRWTQFKNDMGTVALRSSNLNAAMATGDLGALEGTPLPDDPAGDARLKQECHG
jgi:hypothetical protein